MADQSLEKLVFNLKIFPITANGIPFGVPFITMFNPESFSINEKMDWDTEVPKGKNGMDPQYQKTYPRSFSLSFTLDGTGVNGTKIPVTAQIALFRIVTTEIDGSLHRPDFLMVQYGAFISTCIMTSSEVNYTMFDRFGLPLRAKITASFVERTPNKLINIITMLSSPDLTHSKRVKEGDLLPLLTLEIYKNQDFEIQVAKANKLKNFRKLRAGSTLIFPPIAAE